MPKPALNPEETGMPSAPTLSVVENTEREPGALVEPDLLEGFLLDLSSLPTTVINPAEMQRDRLASDARHHERVAADIEADKALVTRRYTDAMEKLQSKQDEALAALALCHHGLVGASTQEA